MVTSSHNPWNWNGVKFKGKFGGSATPAIMKTVEEELRPRRLPRGVHAAIEEVDLKAPYVAAVCKFADIDPIGKANLKLRSIRCMALAAGFLPEFFASAESSMSLSDKN